MLLLLQSNQLGLVDGAIRVLSDFIRDDLSDSIFPTIAPVLMPELIRVFENVDGVKGDVIGIVREFVEVIYMVKEEHPEGIHWCFKLRYYNEFILVVENYLKPLVEMWKGNFQKLLKLPTVVENVHLKNEALKAVVSISRAFPKETEFLVLDFSN
jgi:importin-9